MAKIRLKYIDAFEDRHGSMRYYFRRGKGARVALPGQPGSREFLDAYAEALGASSGPRTVKGADRTIHALVTRFLGSTSYTSLARNTRLSYRRILDDFRTAHGELSAAGFQAKHADLVLTAMLSERGPHPAYSLWRCLRKLMAFAKADHWRPDNPMLAVQAPKRPKSDGYRTATQDDAERFRAFYKTGTRERLAFELLYWTGARRSDVVKMGRQNVADGFLTYRAGKTGEVIVIPVSADLQAAIDAMPMSNMTFILTEAGSGFTGNGFGNWWRDKCRAAGLPGQTSPHTLRKALLTRMADNGATAHEIMAVSGHQNVAEVQTYTKRADRKRLAQSGLAKLASEPKPEHKTPNPAARFGNAVKKVI